MLLRAAKLLAFVAVGAPVLAACTPIPAPPAGNDTPAGARAGAAPDDQDPAAELFTLVPDARPLAIGDRVPDLLLIDAHGARVSLAGLRGRVVALTLFGPGDDPADRAILQRFARVEQRLDARLAERTQLVTVLLDTSGAAAQLLAARATMASRPDVTWTFARPAPGVAPQLAAALRVALWQTSDDRLQHTFNTVIIDAGGRLADQFPGLDGWSAMDIVAAVDHAAAR